MVVATLIGTLASIAIVRSDFPGKRIVLGLLLSPIIVPTIILAIALYYLFARYGLIGSKLGLVLAHTVLAVPYVIVVVSAGLERIDFSLEQAAWTLGAGKIKAFVKVTLPLMRPAVLTAALFSFLASFDEVVIAIFISGTSATTLPKKMWDGIREEIEPTIAAVAALLIALSLVLVFIAEFLRRRSQLVAKADDTLIG
jgi:ABC-type spermidine/putrescine transport system permease subunit II